MRLLLILLLFQLGCTKKHHFVYSDGSFEDLFICYVYPSGFRMDFAGDDVYSAYAQARLFAQTYIPRTEYIRCELSKEQ